MFLQIMIAQLVVHQYLLIYCGSKVIACLTKCFNAIQHFSRTWEKNKQIKEINKQKITTFVMTKKPVCA